MDGTGAPLTVQQEARLAPDGCRSIQSNGYEYRCCKEKIETVNSTPLCVASLWLELTLGPG